MPDDEGIENQWNSIKALYTDTAENTLGYHKPSQTSYQDLDRQIKRKARKDKRTYTGELANEAEQAAKIGNSSKVYKITKKICGRNFQNSKPIKDKNGNTLTNEKEQAARWTEHFKEVLNQPSPAELPTIEEDDPVIDLNTDPPSKDEIKKNYKGTQEKQSSRS